MNTKQSLDEHIRSGVSISEGRIMSDEEKRAFVRSDRAAARVPGFGSLSLEKRAEFVAARAYAKVHHEGSLKNADVAQRMVRLSVKNLGLEDKAESGLLSTDTLDAMEKRLMQNADRMSGDDFHHHTKSVWAGRVAQQAIAKSSILAAEQILKQDKPAQFLDDVVAKVANTDVGRDDTVRLKATHDVYVKSKGLAGRPTRQKAINRMAQIVSAQNASAEVQSWARGSALAAERICAKERTALQNR